MAQWLPEPAPAEFDALRDDIAANGQLDPVRLLNGVLLDGRNRRRACVELGLDLWVEHLAADTSPQDFVLSMTTRRNMSKAQKACVAARLVELLEAPAAKERQRASGGESPAPSTDPNAGRAREAAARRLSVAPSYVQRALAVRRELPETFDAMFAGDVELTKAWSQVRTNRKRARLARPVDAASSDDRTRIVEGDATAELDQLEPASARLLFADPPYDEGFDYGPGRDADRRGEAGYAAWCRSWIDAAVRVLTDDGSFWVLISERRAAMLFGALTDAGLHLRDWIVWAESFGQNRDGNFGRCGRHLLYFCKSPTDRVFNADDIRIDSDRLAIYGDQRAHPAGKVPGNVWTDIPRLTGTAAERVAPLDDTHKLPTQLPVALVERVVLAASNAGDLVVDPFCGTGTTGVACLRHGRRFVGIEREAMTAELSRGRRC